MATNSTLGQSVVSALKSYNASTGNNWSLETPWQYVADSFDDFLANQLFPKVAQSDLKAQKLGNRFDFMAKEVPFIGQVTEEYVILDTVPTDISLDDDTALFYKEQYPTIANAIYGAGKLRKTKYTLNTNDMRFNFSTLQDGVTYALQVYQNAVNGINLDEERQIKAMLVDYAENAIDKTNKLQYRQVGSLDEMAHQINTAVLNLQNNSDRYNEAYKVAPIGRHTTHTNISEMMILTTDAVKEHLLGTFVANTFQIAGIDLTKHVISFDDLGGAWRLTDDVKPTNEDTIKALNVYGQYNYGSIIPKGKIVTFDVSKMPEFQGKVTEIKPANDNFAMILDINAVRYNRYTKNMIKPAFFNGETGNWNHWLHYYSQKKISPFYSKVVIEGQ